MKNRRWTDDELNKAIEYVKNGKTYDEISVLLNRTRSSVRVKLLKEKFGREKFIVYNKKYICLNCGIEFESNYKKKFCNHKCSAIYNNVKRGIKTTECLNCKKEIVGSYKNQKYCSIKCNKEFQKKIIYDKIENGDTTLNSRRYKSYLIHKYGEKCMECGWEKVNPYTSRIPVELEHMDGNSNNNSLNNLKLLCPSCHSLTKTYKGANVGNGRHNRRQRYKEGKSY